MGKKLDVILVGDSMLAGYVKQEDEKEVKILDKYKPKVVLRDIYKEREEGISEYELNNDKDGIRVKCKEVIPLIYSEANKIGAEVIKVNPLTMNEQIKDSDTAEKFLGYINDLEKIMRGVADYHFKNRKEIDDLFLENTKKTVEISYRLGELMADIEPHLSAYLSSEIKKQVDKKYNTPVVAFIYTTFLEDVSENLKEDGINYKKIDLCRYLKTLASG